MERKKEAILPDTIHTVPQNHLKEWGYFYVGGKYVEEDQNVSGVPGEEDKKILRGQMYVEVFVPEECRHPYPLVMFHGGQQTGLNWRMTPDGRKGWVDYFLEQGYLVYAVDAPHRGRATQLPPDGEKVYVLSEEAYDVGFGGRGAEGHVQWLAEGGPGDPDFDAAYATQVPGLYDNLELQRSLRDAGIALLDKIGEAIIITHSQSSAACWLMGDARPELVKGMVVLEPKGPPYGNGIPFPNGIPLDKRLDNYGLADLPLTYDPPVSSPEELNIVRYHSEQEGKDDGWMQAEPARKLPNLAKIPMLLVSGTHSYHTSFDYLTSMYLTQAGVEHTFYELGDYGLVGNGHMLMLEKNNLEIAALVEDWLEKIGL